MPAEENACAVPVPCDKAGTYWLGNDAKPRNALGSPKVNVLLMRQGMECPAKLSGLDLVQVQWERMDGWN